MIHGISVCSSGVLPIAKEDKTSDKYFNILIPLTDSSIITQTHKDSRLQCVHKHPQYYYIIKCPPSLRYYI